MIYIPPKINEDGDGMRVALRDLARLKNSDLPPLADLEPIPDKPDWFYSIIEDFVSASIGAIDVLLSYHAALPHGQGGGEAGIDSESGAPGVRPRDPLSLFISYSHKDERLRDELRGALTAYERKGDLVAWDDTKILPGQKWEAEILKNLERADIIVLLLSNDFIRSDYCMQKEMKRALARDAAGECAIVPIVVRACAFKKLDLGRVQAIQPGGKPVKQHNHRDAAWLEVTNQIEQVIARLKSR